MNEESKISENLNKVIETIQIRNKTLGGAYVGFAFCKNDLDEYVPCYGFIRFIDTNTDLAKPKDYDYGNLLIIKRWLDVNRAVDVLHEIYENGEIKLDKDLVVSIETNMSEAAFVPSRKYWGYTFDKWPVLYSMGSIKHAVRTPRNPINRSGLPLFPNGAEAIVNLLEMNWKEPIIGLNAQVELIIPDFRARIRSLRIAGTTVTLDAETHTIESSQIVAKFFVRTRKGVYTSEELSFDDGKAEYKTPEEPILVEAHITSIQDGTTIDSRNFSIHSPTKWEDTIIEDIDIQLTDIIQNGENETVEFKRELTKGEPDEFLETVIAFANTKGGIILLGVDNNGNIVGFDENPDDRITNWIAFHCEPSILVQIRSDVMVQGKPISIVEVNEGDNKPYNLRNKGIYVRKGSTDRHITRSELDEILDRKRQLNF